MCCLCNNFYKVQSKAGFEWEDFKYNLLWSYGNVLVWIELTFYRHPFVPEFSSYIWKMGRQREIKSSLNVFFIAVVEFVMNTNTSTVIKTKWRNKVHLDEYHQFIQNV